MSTDQMTKSKDWYLRMAHLEGDQPIGAELLACDPCPVCKTPEACEKGNVCLYDYGDHVGKWK